MANDINLHFIRTFEANAIHLVQQKLSKFRSKVTEKTPQSPTEKHSFRYVKPRTAAPVARANVGLTAGKRPDTNYADTEYGNRVVTSTPKNTADSFSKPDMRRMLEDPQSEIYKAMLPQFARLFDDTIIAAFYAAALDESGASTAFGANSISPTVTTGAGNAAEAFKLAGVATLLEAFNTQEVDPDEEKFLAVPAFVLTALLQTTTYTSVDYAAAKALLAGKLTESWCGFTWILSNRLTGPQAGEKYLPAWTRDSMGLLVLGDVNVEIGKNPAAQFDTTIMLEADFGAVRIQDEKVKRYHVTGTQLT